MSLTMSRLCPLVLLLLLVAVVSCHDSPPPAPLNYQSLVVQSASETGQPDQVSKAQLYTALNADGLSSNSLIITMNASSSSSSYDLTVVASDQSTSEARWTDDTPCEYICQNNTSCDGSGDCGGTSFESLFMLLAGATKGDKCEANGSKGTEWLGSMSQQGATINVTYCFDGDTPLSIDIMTSNGDTLVNATAVFTKYKAGAPNSKYFEFPNKCSCSNKA
eukprot:TRINITY_DN263_c2_g1_i1.p1 TRINITY_DN263_c2_g1~~TRINITY_DN263_c2_g1_i1.p1  ORF type:complete len:220 (+),score=36.31 TRINITY_DN263_c2_g1_i1:153-812(+)